ncbi:hypothetical protein AQUCO_02000188v1 [Aquilegia coerulea]|uniref:Uncharacterized protein n=1 Tax=Aquilegia coerulea TaxID=218851 RepID=A0A2G5DGB7_AQUCA|nr:hypothetical protein AQUCO_02000188v1 [Aquilegia coerulea]
MDQNSLQNTTHVLPSSILKSSSQSNPPSLHFDTIDSPADSNLDCTETTPRSRSLASPTSSLSHEFTLAVQTDSFKDIHSHNPNDLQAEEHNNQNQFRPSSSSINEGSSQRTRSSTPFSPILSLPHEHSLAFQTNGENHNNCQNQVDPSSDFVSQLFQPFREDVNNVLNRVIPTNLTRFASAYFDHSERTSHLLCILLESISQARSLYTPLHNLLDVLSLDSPLSQPQSDQASNVFLQFNIHENPFPLRISQNFQEILLCVGALNQQFRSRFIWNIWNSPSSLYDLTVRGSSVLNDDVNIIDRLVTQLQAVVENDKLMVRTGVERGKDRYPLQEMVEQVRKNRTYFLGNLHDLKSHIYLCFWTLNRVRSLLLSAILLHEKTRSSAHESSQAIQNIEEYHKNNQNHAIPSIQALREILYRLKPTKFLQLLVTFNLYSFSQSLDKTRSFYAPLHDLITILPLDSPLSQSQCDQAYDVILQLNLLENPFDSCISQTLTELNQHISSSGPNSSSLRKEELDTANKSAYVLKNDLDTIERLVFRLQHIIEGDKLLIRLLLERGRDRYAIEEVIKQLGKDLPILLTQLMELEEHVVLYAARVNRLSSIFLTEILLQERL